MSIYRFQFVFTLLVSVAMLNYRPSLFGVGFAYWFSFCLQSLMKGLFELTLLYALLERKNSFL